jgi:ribonucleotide monophosphatase NagD (HAD superfamily)
LLFFFSSLFFFFFFLLASRGVDIIQSLTGAPYPHVQYGKPTKHTYDFAETMLRSRVKELHGAAVGSDMQPRLSVSDILIFW